MQENNIKTSYLSLLEVGIWKTKIQNLDTKKWVQKLYDLQKEFPSTKISNIRGYQSPSDFHRFPTFFPLIEQIDLVYKTIVKLPYSNLTSLWFNISSFGHWNTFHTHGMPYPFPPKSLSGVLYLQTPPNCGDICFDTLQNDGTGTYSHSPQEGEIIFFPRTLSHMVEPNLSKEDRISIAFNYE